MSPVVGQLAGTHFSELLAKDLGYNLFNLARGGMSNGAICLQIEEAIKRRPDLILFGTTHEVRTEVNLTNDPFFKDDQEITINDIAYRHHESASSIDPLTPVLMSEPLNFLGDIEGVALSRYPDIPNIKEKCHSLKMAFENLYLNSWKKKIDQWCIYAVLHKLQTSGLPYIWVFDLVGQDLNTMPWLTNTPLFTSKDVFNGWETYIHEGYHTTLETQIEFYSKIKEQHVALLSRC